jgi:hypothetical protein
VSINPNPESARALLYRHGVPEDVVDGVLCLHAQELAAAIRSHPGAIPYRPQLDEDGGFWWDTRDRDAAADLIDPTRVSSAVSVVPPATNQTALRDSIRRAVCEAEGFAWDSDMLEPDEYGDVADAVLAVLPAPVDQAAVLREAANIVRSMDSDYALQEAAEHLDGLAVEADEEREAQAHLDQLAEELAAAIASCPGYEMNPNPCRCPCEGCKHHCGAHDPQPAVAPCVAAEAPHAATPDADDLAARLEAVLTERFTELGNPFSEMRRQEQGPDGWPSSRPVGPHQVAEVLRELLTVDAPAVVAQPGKETDTGARQDGAQS